MTTRSLVLLSLLAACRPDPGANDYANQESFGDGGHPGGEQEPVPGPGPFLPGEDRMSLGMFYESGRSAEVLVDGVQAHFYIYEETFSVATSNDRVEGLSSDALVHAGGAWWGGGIHWEAARDISRYDTLHVSLRSGDATHADVELAMGSAEGSTRPVAASEYGYANDDAWHHLAIPLSAYVEQGVDLAAVLTPFELVGGAGGGGEKLKLDNVYLSVED